MRDRRAGRGRGIAVLSCALAGLLTAEAAWGSFVPEKHIHCANPSGNCHKVLVIPVRYPSVCPGPGMPCDPGLVNDTFCPVAGQPCDPSLWLHAPREDTQALAAEINGVNPLYDDWSFQTWQYDFDVLHNPDSPDGWWTLPASYQSYYQSLTSGANFWHKGSAQRSIVEDAIEQIAGPASLQGLIPSLLLYSRFVVVDSNHDRYGQTVASVLYSIPITGIISTNHLFGGSLVGVASNAANLRSVLAHELGHQTGLALGYDLYGLCSIDETPLPPFIQECNGGWDIMGLDFFGPNHPTAYTKLAVGWIPDAPNYVTTLPPTHTAGSYSLSIGPEETLTGSDPRWVRIPTAAWTPGTPFEGYGLECRRPIAGELDLPEEGLLILKVQETDPGVAIGGFMPVRAIRTELITPSWQTAALQPGETWGDTAQGLAIVFNGYDGPAADAPCLVDVTYSPLGAQPDLAINPGVEGWPDLWLDSDVNGFGNFPANVQIDADGAPNGPGDPFQQGAWNRLYYRVRNIGNNVSSATTIHLRAQQPPKVECGAQGPSILDVYGLIPPLQPGEEFIDKVGIQPPGVVTVLVRADIQGVSAEVTLGNNHAEQTFNSHSGSTLVVNDTSPLIISPAFTNACGDLLKASVVPRQLPAIPSPRPEPDPALFWNVTGPGLLEIPDGSTVSMPIEILPPAAATAGTVLETKLDLQVGGGSFSSPGAVEGDELHTVLSMPLRVAVVEPAMLTAQLDTNVQLVGGMFTVSGRLLPAVQGSLLGLRYTPPSGEPFVQVAPSDADGVFSDLIEPLESGPWIVEVMWQGDDTRTEAMSDPLPFDVLPPGSCFSVTDCDDGNPCTDNQCDLPSHACQFPPLLDGTACEDGDACTIGNTCGGGVCGTPVSCDDGIPCTVDSCEPFSGICVNTPVPPQEVNGVAFVDATQVVWAGSGTATTWNTYRGSVPADGLGSRRTPYDHSCLESGDEFRDGATLTTDPAVPPSWTAFYYLITGDSDCGEGSAGVSSAGVVRTTLSACP